MNAFKTLADDLKPRERMEKLGSARGMRPEELIAILLKTGAPGCDVGETSRRFVGAFHTVRELVNQDWRGLLNRIAAHNKANPARRILGVGKVKCMELAAAFELVRQAYDADAVEDLPQEVNEGADAAQWFRSGARLGDDREHFYVLPLDAAHKPLSSPVCVSSGLLNGTPAGAREVFAQAVQWQAAAIVVAHNHPSGDPTPSKKDIALTEELIAASKVLRIPLLDHIVIGRDTFVSLREDGYVSAW